MRNYGQSTEVDQFLRDIVCQNQTKFLLFDRDSHQIRCFPDISKETVDRKGNENKLVKIHILGVLGP